MHCCKHVWKLPYTHLHRSSSIVATSSTMACLSSWIVMIRLRNTRSFRNPHRKKSGTVSSGDRADQAMSPKRETTVRNIVARSNAPLRLTLWNGLLSSTIPLPANHNKLSRRRNIQIWNVSVGSAPPGSIKLVDILRHEFHCACEIYKAVNDPCCIIILQQIFDYFLCRLDVAKD